MGQNSLCGRWIRLENVVILLSFHISHPNDLESNWITNLDFTNQLCWNSLCGFEFEWIFLIHFQNKRPGRTGRTEKSNWYKNLNLSNQPSQNLFYGSFKIIPGDSRVSTGGSLSRIVRWMSRGRSCVLCSWIDFLFLKLWSVTVVHAWVKINWKGNWEWVW